MSHFELYDSKGRGPILISEEDWDLVKGYTWRVFKGKRHPDGYAATTVRTESGRTTLLMHRLIRKVRPGYDVDHINNNSLDNRNSNLREVTRQQNSTNSIKRKIGAGSKFKGVTWEKRHLRWVASITKNYKVYYLGEHRNEIDAAKAYNKKAKELFGEFANLNEVPDEP
jgi:hypothetical protein